MGCICSKGAHPEEEPQPGETVQTSTKASRRLVSSSRRGDVVVVATDTDDGGTVRLLPKSQENSVTPPAVVVLEGKNMVPVHVVIDAPAPRKQTAHRRRATVDGRNGEVEMVLRFPNVPCVAEAEHVAAGWPSWLVSVAGEAIKGWVPRRPDAFEKLDKIGQGTYSSVYKARDLETGKIVALKKVRFVNMDPESVRFMAREIHVLRRLDHPNIVKLEGLITSRASSSLYLVFEYMEHDLAGLAATPGIKFTEPQVKCYMQQLLNGLHHCHSRGILHRDIKGSNLLIDDNGILKIADFGLATLFDPDNKQPLTSRVVTLWYRPPELLLGATGYGVAVDLWSTGCILAELLAGKPIMPGRTEVEQMHKIFKLCGSPSEEYWTRSKLPHATIFKPQHPYRRCVHETFKYFPPSALALLDTLLAIRPEERGTTASALSSDFFTTEPYACDPSNLPKYPPSKEFDAKLREEEAMRQRMEANPANGAQIGRDTSKRVTDTTISGMPLQRTQTRQISRRDRSDLLLENGGRASGTARNVISHSGPLVHPVAFGHSMSKKVTEHENRAVLVRGLNAQELKTQKSYMPQGRGGDLSILPGLSTARATAKSENHREKGKHTNWPENRLDVVEASDMQEWRRHVDFDAPSCSSSNKKDERMCPKEANMGYGTRKNRIHYSGPLMPPGGNLEEMLKEHERQIQQAVRKARLDKAKTNKNYTDHRPI